MMPSGARFPRSRKGRPGEGQQKFDLDFTGENPADSGDNDLESTVAPDQAWDYYWPTKTIDPTRPRTQQARYNLKQKRLEVIFRDGTPWHYEDVHPNTWRAFKNNESPGRTINRLLNSHPYGRGGWGTMDDIVDL
jgi:hypothetical protein